MITRRQVVDCARTYIGTPFQHQGRLRGRALDCVGLVICVAQELGIKLPLAALTLNYPPEPVSNLVLDEAKRNLIEKSVEQIKMGDVICLRVPVPCHVALATDLEPGIGIIHAYSGNDKVVEHTLDLSWRRRIAGVFSFPEVED